MPLPHVLHLHVWRPIWDLSVSATAVSATDEHPNLRTFVAGGDNKGACAMLKRVAITVVLEHSRTLNKSFHVCS